jgi:hypothetical protein
MRRQKRRLGRAIAALFFAVTVCSCSGREKPLPRFRQIVEDLSEKGGYFDTDNLISNEAAYVQVVDKLSPSGGAYLGVGPEQNFHYIGRLRPSWAFIVDVRRDNMLQHLVLNAILVEAETPYDYLCWLFSRRCGGEVAAETFSELVAEVESAPPDRALFDRNLNAILEHIETRLGFPLDDEDGKTVELVYRAFFDRQLGLRFQSHGRPPMPYHPTYRGLLVATGPDGTPSSFLSRPDDYAHVRRLAREGRLIPVVGDFAGPHALRAVGDFIRKQGETVSAFYVSNVEFYLMREGLFETYVENVRSLPRSDASQFIRAYFSYGYPHPAALPGYRSTLVRQKMSRFLELYDTGAYLNYWDVSTLDYEK